MHALIIITNLGLIVEYALLRNAVRTNGVHDSIKRVTMIANIVRNFNVLDVIFIVI